MSPIISKNKYFILADNGEDGGEWVVKASAKRQPRQRPSHHNNNAINTENENRKYLVEGDSEEEDGYMSWTEHELSKHVKATQLKNIRTHPGVPLAVRRSLK
ncbi:hypothetical protein BGX30_010487 [Mortierella sp. GBA39]|nr:hypothetical protein BGX30_010487 [Mortierella sp. GBA39]